MSISHQIEAVYQRALDLRQRATASPLQPDLLNDALRELYFVLEELQTADEELQQQNQALLLARQQLEVERHRYQALFDLAPDAYLVTNYQGKIYQANRAAEALFAVPPNYLINKPLIVFVEADHRPQFQAYLAQPGHIQNWQIGVAVRHQVPRLVAISTAAIKDSQGQETAILWSLRDLTWNPSQNPLSPPPETLNPDPQG
ncbi:MAG: PAS domain-containing protein [Nodosilinea sp.]